MQRVADELDLHQLAVEDAVRPHQRPKLEQYEDKVFLVIKTLRYIEPDDAVETGQIAVFLSRRYVVTVRLGEGSNLEGVRSQAEARHEVLGHGPVAALYTILDEVVDGYERVAAELENDVEEVEHSVFSTDRTRDSERIYGLKRETLEVRRAVVPLTEPLRRFFDDDVDVIGEQAVPFFRDVIDHLTRVADAVDSVDSLLDNVLNAHLARLSIQQNEDTRRVSAWAALFLAPTLVAGIYGMNFDQIPELHWTLGYPFALLMMICVSVGLWFTFKRSGWL